jgi:predicted acetyltransferase
MALRLRPYRLEDEPAARAAHEAILPEDFQFLLSWDPAMSWAEFLGRVEDQRRSTVVTEDRVPAVQLAAVVDGELVGRAAIRFALNEFLSTIGGHIGYAVVPAHRRRGYATEILRQSLVVLRAGGVERALVTCYDTNVGSARAIEANGGVFESLIRSGDGGGAVRRYWID